MSWLAYATYDVDWDFGSYRGSQGGLTSYNPNKPSVIQQNYTNGLILQQKSFLERNYLGQYLRPGREPFSGDVWISFIWYATAGSEDDKYHRDIPFLYVGGNGTTRIGFAWGGNPRERTVTMVTGMGTNDPEAVDDIVWNPAPVQTFKALNANEPEDFSHAFPRFLFKLKIDTNEIELYSQYKTIDSLTLHGTWNNVNIMGNNTFLNHVVINGNFYSGSSPAYPVFHVCDFMVATHPIDSTWGEPLHGEKGEHDPVGWTDDTMDGVLNSANLGYWGKEWHDPKEADTGTDVTPDLIRGVALATEENQILYMKPRKVPSWVEKECRRYVQAVISHAPVAHKVNSNLNLYITYDMPNGRVYFGPYSNGYRVNGYSNIYTKWKLLSQIYTYNPITESQWTEAEITDPNNLVGFLTTMDT